MINKSKLLETEREREGGGREGGKDRRERED